MEAGHAHALYCTVAQIPVTQASSTLAEALSV